MTKLALFSDQQQHLASLFKALAHPARIAILQYLSETNTCVSGDISNELPLSRTTVQQHLQELKSAGIIRGDIDGVRTSYCLNPTSVEEIKQLLTGFTDNLLKFNNVCC